MRGELDDALARMARREELLRRQSAQPAEGSRPPAGAPRPTNQRTRFAGDSLRPPAEGGRPPAEGTRLAADGMHRPLADGTRSPAEEVAEAVRRVVAHHPGLTVSLTVDNGTARAAIRVGWSAGAVTIAPAAEPAAPVSAPTPPAWPLSVKTVPSWEAVSNEQNGDSAARLAALIRRDPSLLGGLEDQL